MTIAFNLKRDIAFGEAAQADLFGDHAEGRLLLSPPNAEDSEERRALLDLALRAQRDHHQLLRDFPRALFGNPNWMIMLACTIALLEGRLPCVKQIRAMIDESGTAALRRIDALEALGLVGRRRDPDDGRRTHVLLTPRGYMLMRGHLRHLSGDREMPLQRH